LNVQNYTVFMCNLYDIFNQYIKQVLFTIMLKHMINHKDSN